MKLQAYYLFFIAFFLITHNGMSKTDRHRTIWIKSPQNHTIIGWNQVSGEQPTVYYGTIDFEQDYKKYKQNATPIRQELYMDMDNRFVELNGLEPDTKYFFVIKDSEGVSERYWFRTASNKNQAYSFIVGGDTKSDRNINLAGNNLVKKLKPLFVVYGGDFTRGNGLDPQEWKNWLEDWSEGATTETGRIIPIVPVRGNHESKPEILYKLFCLEASNNIFSFGIGKDLTRFYILNTELKDEKNITDQKEWLKQELKNTEHFKFKLATYHKPMRPHTAKKPNNEISYSFAPLFFQHKMSIVMENDAHLHKITYPIIPSDDKEEQEGFKRDDKNGTIFIGEGSWGAPPRPNDKNRKWTLNSASIHQLKWLHVFPDHIEIRTIPTLENKNLKENTEDDLLKIPENIKLFMKNTKNGVVFYPFNYLQL